MKKIISLVLTVLLAFSMTTVAFAEAGDTEISNKYTLTGDTTASSPAESFKFTIKATDVTDAADTVTVDNMPVPTVDDADYAMGDATTDGAIKNIGFTLPEYTSVGIYTYTITPVKGDTAGVTYYEKPITLVVTVACEEPGATDADAKYTVIAIHTEEIAKDNEGNVTSTKLNDIESNYSAGKLSVSKTVTGNLGDREKAFDMTVTFTAPTDTTVKSTISYMVGTETFTINPGWIDGEATADISLKHGDTITFTNIPDGVKYAVVEDDYAEDGYDDPTYVNETGEIVGNETDAASVTNNKEGEIDTGILLDTAPFILILSVCAVGVVVFMIKRRKDLEF